MTLGTFLTPTAEKLLLSLRADESFIGNSDPSCAERGDEIAELAAADLIITGRGGRLRVSAAGQSYLARRLAAQSSPAGDALDPFLAQHMDAAIRNADGPTGATTVRINETESPLIWLARRKNRDGSPLISPMQLQAGERLRADFTRAQLTPRVTAEWTAVGRSGRSGGAQGMTLSDMVVAARQCVRHALAAVGPEFAGLLLDVCCFLKRLEDVERERQWPVRSAKVVLHLGLDRLARHYGFEVEAKGPRSAAIRTWLASDAAFAVDAP